jgi:hypothetical protein
MSGEPRPITFFDVHLALGHVKCSVDTAQTERGTTRTTVARQQLREVGLLDAVDEASRVMRFIVVAGVILTVEGTTGVLRNAISGAARRRRHLFVQSCVRKLRAREGHRRDRDVADGVAGHVPVRGNVVRSMNTTGAALRRRHLHRYGPLDGK